MTRTDPFRTHRNEATADQRHTVQDNSYEQSSNSYSHLAEGGNFEDFTYPQYDDWREIEAFENVDRPIRDRDYPYYAIADDDSYDTPIKENPYPSAPIPIDQGYSKEPITEDGYPADSIEDTSDDVNFSYAEAIEKRYGESLAGFRDDPFGGHWSSPTQSEMEQIVQYERLMDTEK